MSYNSSDDELNMSDDEFSDDDEKGGSDIDDLEFDSESKEEKGEGSF